MSFAAPIWLILLAPWGLLTIWLLLGKRDRVAVPFLPLWDNTQTAPKTKRSIRLPPLAVLLMLAAMLLAIVAAGGPRIRDNRTLSIVALVDRGITMSPEDRMSYLVRGVPGLLRPRGFDDVQAVAVPGEPFDRLDLPPNVLAIDTRELLSRAIVDRLKRADLPVAVLSDQSVDQTDPRLIQIGPEIPLNNVGIISVVARATPRAQIMVRVRNQSDLGDATLTVKSGNAVQTQKIQLPAREGEGNFFVDLPALSEIVEVKLDASDDLPVDNVAWLVRQRTWAKIEPIDPLPTGVQRMIDVYRKNRPADANSTKVFVSNDVTRLPANRAGLAFASNATFAPVDPAQLAIAPHNLTRDVDWKELAGNAMATTLPPGDWTPLVRAGNRILLAVREKDRQAFIGFDAHAAATSAQFVVLCGKLFDWAGQGGDVYVTDRVHPIDDAWKLIETDDSTKRYDPPLPGVYRRADGALLAMSAIDVRFDPPIKTDLSKLDQMGQGRVAWIALRPALLVMSMVALCIALLRLNPRPRS